MQFVYCHIPSIMAGDYVHRQERFDDWESRGVKIVPVLSRPDGQWAGERGYVQVLLSFLSRVISSLLCSVCYRFSIAFCRMCSQG